MAGGADGRMYVQVTEDMTDPKTLERELAPLRALSDAYPKAVRSPAEIWLSWASAGFSCFWFSG